MINAPEPPFELTDGEKNSAVWIRLVAHMKDRLEILRSRNDLVQPEDKTAALRGEIKCLKDLISLSGDRPKLTGDRFVTARPDRDGVETWIR